jgi:ABC-2 type transport system permease protein
MAKNKKRSDLFNLGLGLVILVLVNVLSQYLFTRIDLTAEKRYTLAESTKEMLGKLDDVVYFRVYLEGEFPQGSGDYKRLRDEARIMLDEFRAYGGDKIQYEFIDPGENPDKKARIAFQQQLVEKGLMPTQGRFTDDNGAEVTQWLFPWALASYHQREVAVPLMGSNAPRPNEVILNHAVEGLEYEFSNGIRKLQMRMKPKVAITQGHGEPDSLQLNDLVKGLREYYDVEFVPVNGNLRALRDTMQDSTQIRNKYKAVIVAGPDSAFTPADLFILDQFVMYGGQALFLVDPMLTDIDSFSRSGQTASIYNQNLGLQDLIYRYGARLNGDLVEDLYCAQVFVPVNGPQMQFVPVPWYFSPTILPQEKHPVVRNLDRIKFDFLSTIDTVATNPGIRKTILVRSSDKSRFQRAPVPISLREAMMERSPRSFNKPNLPVAVLLEGNFDSYYKNKFLPDELKRSKSIGYQERSLRESKIIVVGDGDVARNPVQQGKPLPLGTDLMNRRNPEFYANKTFLLNCMNYLCDDKGLLAVRSREVTLRMLDRGKIKDHRLKWQLINTLGPIGLLVGFGFISVWARRRKYVHGKELPVALRVALLAIPVLGVYMLFDSWIGIAIAVAIVLFIFGLHWLLSRNGKSPAKR